MSNINQTIRRFGFPATLIAEYDHWVLLVRPTQPTLGSLILAARGEATAFGDLAPGANGELKRITGEIEAALAVWPGYERINYLMLMMVDRHVHFHVIPRYDGERSDHGLTIRDAGWPGPPDLTAAVALDAKQISRLAAKFAENISLL